MRDTERERSQKDKQTEGQRHPDTERGSENFRPLMGANIRDTERERRQKDKQTEGQRDPDAEREGLKISDPIHLFGRGVRSASGRG